ncbi:MAG: hypothetical protein J6X12_01350, partial [Paludibacteraceae bacterium]|nr:hypothetical protein [Paludibacteraceae bacterium]
VADVCQLMLHKRSKAVYYGQKYSMIPFYSESSDSKSRELILALMFVPDEKCRKKYPDDLGYRLLNFDGLTTKIAEKLLVDPSLMIIKKEDAAILADYVYGPEDNAIGDQVKEAFDKSDWEECPVNDPIRITAAELGLITDHSICGFQSKLYRHKGKNAYCYVTRGTDFGTEFSGTHGRTFGKDGKTDIEQVYGEYLYQYVHSVAAAKKLYSVIVEYYNWDLCFVGHSLGGGLAICNSLATGCPAIKFNPAGISEGTLEYFNEKYKFDQDRRVLERNVLESEYKEEFNYMNEYLKNEVPKLEAEISRLKTVLEECRKRYSGGNGNINTSSSYIDERCYASQTMKEISELENEIAKANEDLRKINEEKELVDLMFLLLKDEPLYFISTEGENVLNYVIKLELVDVLNSVTSYSTEPIGSYIYIDLNDNPKTEEYRFNHSIDRFLEYWGFIDPDKKKRNGK